MNFNEVGLSFLTALVYLCLPSLIFPFTRLPSDPSLFSRVSRLSPNELACIVLLRTPTFTISTCNSLPNVLIFDFQCSVCCLTSCGFCLNLIHAFFFFFKANMSKKMLRLFVGMQYVATAALQSGCLGFQYEKAKTIRHI